MSDTSGPDPIPTGGPAPGAPVYEPAPSPVYQAPAQPEPAYQAPAYAQPAYQTPPPPAPVGAPRAAKRGGGRTFAVALFGAILGAALFAGGFYFAGSLPPVTPVVAPSPVLTTATVETTDTLEAAAAKVLPSVVNVAVSGQGGSGVGSGIILTSDGYILTNNHVVEGASSVTVRFGADDLAATIVGTDPTTDIAVIHVSKTGLPAASLAPSIELRVGQTLIAIGSPFGLDKTVTSGIVSALHRSDLVSGMSGITSYTNLIQTDAAINPGNSGGALADLSGTVVGMNTLIQSPSGTLGAAQSAGIGFAIPIDFAKSIADTIISGKKVTHPYLGASTLTVTPDLAYYYGLPADSGAIVQDVATGSPADKAGMQVGDIIVKFGTRTVTSMEELFVAVNDAKLGVAVPVEINRDGRAVTLNVTLVAQ